MKFENALTKKPTGKIVDGISSVGVPPDYHSSLEQHKNYVKSLEECGLEVKILDGDERYPDSVFVEDTAVLTEEVAVLCNLGAESRQGEESSILEPLLEFYEDVKRIRPPGTFEGGDVMRIENIFYVGLSQRTNKEGFKQFKDIVEEYDYKVHPVNLKDMFHLKTGIAYLGDDVCVVSGELKDNLEFRKYDLIEVPDVEMYAANCICVNDKVILPEGYPRTKSLIEEKGFTTINVDVSEFRKLDGGISCLSLRF